MKRYAALGRALIDAKAQNDAILADGINLGLTRMAEACPGVSLSALSRIATWHIWDETYAKALAEVVNHHHRLEFAAHWGDGTTSSSDGQRFKAGGSGEAIGSVNARYGNEPGATDQTHHIRAARRILSHPHNGDIPDSFIVPVPP